jgi:Spy/CpxP family protein refolding chaperone
MMDIQTKQAADIRAILTADQQATFDKNLAEMKARMANRSNGSS